MARTSTSQSSDSPRDAVALLKQDHRAVEALFAEFEDADETEQSALAARICQFLTVHATIEEEILYPAAKQAFGEDEDDDLVNEAEVEHGSAKELIAKLEGMTPEDEHFAATVKVLSEYIKHHVKEEEGELFPKLKQTELDLKDMGTQLTERKFELMEQMGIHPEEAPQTARRGSGGSSRSASKRSKSASGNARAARSGAAARRSASSRSRGSSHRSTRH